MILPCNYEELSALREGARAVLGDGREGGPPVAAPPESRALVESLVELLDAPLSIETLSEQQGVLGAVEAIVERLRVHMESEVLAHHPAGEAAVAAYFDFAHALSVRDRLRRLGAEMSAMIELMTGEAPDPETARTVRFPD